MTSLSPDAGWVVVLSATVGACVVSTTASVASVVSEAAGAFVVSGAAGSSTGTEVAAALVALGSDPSIAAPPQAATRQTASATPNRDGIRGLFQTTDPDAQTRVTRR